MKKWVNIGAGLLISGAALYFFCSKINLTELKGSLSKFPLANILLAAFFINIIYVWRGLRLKIILSGYRSNAATRMMIISIISFAANNLLPARLGEVARVIYLSKKEQYPISISTGSLIMERLTDILGFLTLGVLPLFLFNSDLLATRMEGLSFFGRSLSIRDISFICLGLLAAELSFLVVSFLMHGSSEKIAEAFSRKFPHRWRPKIKTFLYDMLSVLYFLRNPKLLAGVLANAVLVMLCYCCGLWIITLPFQPSFTISQAAVTLVILAAGVALPSAPGYIGTMHFFLILALGLFSVPVSEAGAIAIVYHLCNFVPSVAMGIFFYLRDQIPIKEMKETAAARRTHAAEG